MSEEKILLKVQDLKIHFPVSSSLFSKRFIVHAVDGVSFEVKAGTTFGLVGESGSGKTTTAMGIMRLEHVTSGRIELDGLDLTALDEAGMRDVRRRLQIIFQDPYSSLNPRVRAGDIVREAVNLLNLKDRPKEDEEVARLFRCVGLRPEQQILFPHQFSGGQRQRIGIARALAPRPDLILCDEPVSALDVAIQAQILNLLRRLQDEIGLTYIFVSHDLGVVQYMCDEIAVMYLGRIVEAADRISLFKNPLHPYTKSLLSAVPSAKVGRNHVSRIKLQGEPPSPIHLPPGCRFHPRCPLAKEICSQQDPQILEAAAGHRVACHRINA